MKFIYLAGFIGVRELTFSLACRSATRGRGLALLSSRGSPLLKRGRRLECRGSCCRGSGTCRHIDDKLISLSSALCFCFLTSAWNEFLII